MTCVKPGSNKMGSHGCMDGKYLPAVGVLASAPAADGDPSTKVVLPGKENPAARQRPPFQYQSCTSRKGKSSRPPSDLDGLSVEARGP